MRLNDTRSHGGLPGQQRDMGWSLRKSYEGELGVFAHDEKRRGTSNLMRVIRTDSTTCSRIVQPIYGLKRTPKDLQSGCTQTHPNSCHFGGGIG
jgi:hypothetical protein